MTYWRIPLTLFGMVYRRHATGDHSVLPQPLSTPLPLNQRALHTTASNQNRCPLTRCLLNRLSTSRTHHTKAHHRALKYP